MLFFARFNEVADLRRCKGYGYSVLMAFNAFFVMILLFVPTSYAIYWKTESVFKVGEFLASDYIMALICFFFGLGISFVNLKPLLLDRLSILFRGYKSWMLGMAVEVFFEWLDKLDGGSMVGTLGVTIFDARIVSVFGFAAVGFMVTSIGMHYKMDRTGLTVGCFIAGVKVTLKYVYEEEKHHPNRYEWVTILALIMSCLFCRFTEIEPPKDNNQEATDSSPRVVVVGQTPPPPPPPAVADRTGLSPQINPPGDVQLGVVGTSSSGIHDGSGSSLHRRA